MRYVICVTEATISVRGALRCGVRTRGVSSSLSSSLLYADALGGEYFGSGSGEGERARGAGDGDRCAGVGEGDSAAAASRFTTGLVSGVAAQPPEAPPASFTRVAGGSCFTSTFSLREDDDLSVEQSARCT